MIYLSIFNREWSLIIDGGNGGIGGARTFKVHAYSLDERHTINMAFKGGAVICFVPFIPGECMH